jgi:hypothetical protein
MFRPLMGYDHFFPHSFQFIVLFYSTIRRYIVWINVSVLTQDENKQNCTIKDCEVFWNPILRRNKINKEGMKYKKVYKIRLDIVYWIGRSRGIDLLGVATFRQNFTDFSKVYIASIFRVRFLVIAGYMTYSSVQEIETVHISKIPENSNLTIRRHNSWYHT